MGRAALTLAGVMVLAIIAGILTEASLAIGGRGLIADDFMVRRIFEGAPTPTATPSPTPAPTLSSTPTPTPATPAPTPTPTPAGPRATTISFVHMRAGKSTSTAILTDLNGGTVLRVLPDSDAQWQQVDYNGLTGYIFKAYLSYQ